MHDPTTTTTTTAADDPIDRAVELAEAEAEVWRANEALTAAREHPGNTAAISRAHDRLNAALRRVRELRATPVRKFSETAEQYAERVANPSERPA